MSSIPSQTSSPVSATPTSSDSDADSTSTWASIPPMITQWRQPDSVECHFTFDVADLASMAQGGISAWLDLQVDPSATTFSCYPPGMFDNGNSGTFSPALCPVGWTTAGAFGATGDAGDVTTRTCCSNGFTHDGEGHCIGAFTDITATPASYISSLSSYSLLTESVTVLPTATAVHHRIEVQFEDGDKEALGLLDEDEILEQTGHDLPMSTKIGITFAALAVVCLISLAICLFLRWRKAKDAETDMERQQHRNSRRSRPHQQRPLDPPRYERFGAVAGSNYRNSESNTTAPGAVLSPPQFGDLRKSRTGDSEVSDGVRSEKSRSQRLNSDATVVQDQGVVVLLKDEATATSTTAK
ncbi:hypothetical protein TD95_003080 [Thielaviopsis punctulata]|uniref:Uncharacterized protein n=1 Tax=Thielaviopsis punctulata TaxID=72032 RepID=A0A0F4ZF01_9PEZI|nr:hypothetical protein TD95_003080 [Thielaviopsis punctulata]